MKKADALGISILVLLLLTSFYLPTRSAWAATYYMRADGTATNKAAATSSAAAATSMSVATHNSQTFADGDVIRLSSKGGTYKDTMRPPSNGSSVGITYTNEIGETPTFDLSTPVTGWLWRIGRGVYRKPGARAEIFFEDQVILKRASSAANVGVDGYWYWDGQTLYYKPTIGTASSHTVERVSSDNDNCNGFFVLDKSYITIQNLIIKKCWYGVFFGNYNGSNYSHNTVQGCTISQCASGICSTIYDNTAGLYLNALNNKISYCALAIPHDMTNGGDNAGGTGNFNHCLVQGNTIDHNGFINPSLVPWSNLVSDTDQEAISFQDPISCTVENNVITNGHHYGIFLYGTNSGKTHLTNNIVRRNYVNTSEMGLYFVWDAGFAGAYGNIWEYNIVNQCGDPNSTLAAVEIGQNTNPDTGANYFCNNVIYRGNSIGLYIAENDAGTWVIENNILDGIGYHVFLNQAGASSYEFDYNLYTSDGYKFSVGESDYTFASWKTAVGGQEYHSPTPADPQWLNASGSYNTATDFQIQADSPCVNAGDNLGFDGDFWGEALPLAPYPVDIGVHQIPATPTPPPTPTPTCTYSLSPDSQSFAYAGGSGSIQVTSTSNCSWTATTAASWITIASGSGGIGSGQVSFSVAPNTAATSRTGAITMAGQQFTVSQAAAPAPPTYSISPTSQSFTAAGGSGTVNVTASAGASWTASSSLSWITITSGSSGTGNGQVNFQVAANKIFLWGTSSRTGVMVIAGQQFTVSQAGK